MKHIIVIETPDTPKLVDIQKEEFQQTTTRIVEMIAYNYYDEVFVRSEFFTNSAVKAIAEMYNVKYSPEAGFKEKS